MAFQSNRGGDTAIFWQSADGGTAERLTKPDQGAIHYPGSWPQNSQRFTFQAYRNSEKDVWMFSIPEKKPMPFAAIPRVSETRSALSDDGRWVAYQSEEGGGAGAVFVQPYPASGARYQVSPSGLDPAWSPDGKELFYIDDNNRLMAVNIKAEPTFTFSAPAALPIPAIRRIVLGVRNYDVLPDGKRFIVVLDADRASESRPAPQIQIVLNWLEELKQRVPVK